MTLHDHDRINVAQAYLTGVVVAMRRVLDAVERLAADDPVARREITAAREAMAIASADVDRLDELGRRRWAEMPEANRRPDDAT